MNKIVLFFYEDNLDVIQYVWKKNIYILANRETFNILDEQIVTKLIEFKIEEADVYIPDDKSYLKLLKLTPRKEILQIDIAKEVENFIPETIKPEDILWTQIASSENEIVVAVRIIKNNYLNKILELLNKINTKVEKYIFESDAIAKSRQSEVVPEIIVYEKKTTSLVIAIYDGNVWQSVATNKENVSILINQIKIDLAENWKIIIEKVIEEKRDIAEILPNQMVKKKKYNSSIKLLIFLIIMISMVTLFIFVPMIVKNIQQIQNNQNKIENLIN